MLKLIPMRRFLLLAVLLFPILLTAEETWLPFNPKPDPFTLSSAIDLRKLNEKQAGDGGFIAAALSQFVHSGTKEPVRFWAVNGCPGDTSAELRRSARVLSKYGVNLVRIQDRKSVV